MIEDTKIILSSFRLNCRCLSSNWATFRNQLCDLHSKDSSFGVIWDSEVFCADRNPCVVFSEYHNIIIRRRNDICKGDVGLFISIHSTCLWITIYWSRQWILYEKIISDVIFRAKTTTFGDIDVFSSTMFNIMEMTTNHEGKPTWFLRILIFVYWNIELIIKLANLLLVFNLDDFFQLFTNQPE